MGRFATWSNSDSLDVGFGTHSSDNEIFREVAGQDSSRIIQGYLTLASTVDTYAVASYPASPHEAVIPRGSVCLRGSVQAVAIATSGSTSTLDLGTWSRGLTTEVVDDADGLVADATEAELGTIGEIHLLDGAMIVAAGSSTAITVGATGNMDCVIAPSWETAVFSGGTVLVTLEFLVPFGRAGATITV